MDKTQINTLEKVRNVLKYQIPRNIIANEISGVYGSELLEEINQIINYYDIYENGADFMVSGTKDFIGGDLKYKKIKTLIDKQSRFMFSNPPTVNISVLQEDEDKSTTLNISPEDFQSVLDKDSNLTSKKNETEIQDFVDKVLKSNSFNSKLVKASKDCFIGKRVALLLNFNENGIQMQFANSLEFVYDTDQESDEITKILCFFMSEDNKQKEHQRIYRKNYELENGKCYVEESLYNGNGEIVEEITARKYTGLDFVPAVVIINDGLTGDMLGDSEVSQLNEYESYYSKLSNADMDAERMNMNAIRYLMNVDPRSSSGLTVSPGSLWDLFQDQSLNTGSSPSVGVVESNMAYSQPLESTLKRINTTMYEQIDVPDVSSEGLKGMITSGKALKAIYWGLTVRCQEKCLEWNQKLEKAVKMIIEGSKAIPVSLKPYHDKQLPVIEYDVTIINNSPIQEDEVEAKQMALSEVSAQTLSRKTYLKRFYDMNDKEALDEIYQIAMETRIIEDSFMDSKMTNEEQIKPENDDITADNEENDMIHE